MNIIATVLRVNPRSLLVRNEENGEEILVHYRNAGRFSVGNRVRITFNGQMTRSIPPQITATSIQRLNAAPAPRPSEMRAVVLRVGRGFLVVRNTQNRQEVRVDFPQAHHFCPRQQVIVRFNNFPLIEPPRVTATDIIPIC